MAQSTIPIEAAMGSRHPGAAVLLLVPAVVFILCWSNGQVALMAAISLILCAGGLGLLTRTSIGRWLGGLAAVVLVLAGILPPTTPPSSTRAPGGG